MQHLAIKIPIDVLGAERGFGRQVTQLLKSCKKLKLLEVRVRTMHRGSPLRGCQYAELLVAMEHLYEGLAMLLPLTR